MLKRLHRSSVWNAGSQCQFNANPNPSASLMIITITIITILMRLLIIITTLLPILVLARVHYNHQQNRSEDGKKSGAVALPGFHQRTYTRAVVHSSVVWQPQWNKILFSRRMMMQMLLLKRIIIMIMIPIKVIIIIMLTTHIILITTPQIRMIMCLYSNIRSSAHGRLHLHHLLLLLLLQNPCR